MRKLMILFFLLMSNISLKADSSDVNYFTRQNIYRFAIHLYGEGDYLRAAGEFQRYLYGFDALPDNADSVLFKIGICYQFKGNTSKAIEYFDKIIHGYPQSVYHDQAYYKIGLLHFLLRKHEESITYLNTHLLDVRQNAIASKMDNLIWLNYMHQKKWDKALQILNTSVYVNSSKTFLIRSTKEAQNLPRKNQFLAGLFSTFIPGSGKIYCNRLSDGFYSAFFIGLMGWQAYEGFHRDGVKSTKGWIYGPIGSAFYLGNIYGSIVAARIYNEQQEDKFLESIRFVFKVDF